MVHLRKRPTNAFLLGRSHAKTEQKEIPLSLPTRTPTRRPCPQILRLFQRRRAKGDPIPTGLFPKPHRTFLTRYPLKSKSTGKTISINTTSPRLISKSNATPFKPNKKPNMSILSIISKVFIQICEIGKLVCHCLR